jgi:hypothetical protein
LWMNLKEQDCMPNWNWVLSTIPHSSEVKRTG